MKIALIIPCFNEEKRLDLEAYAAFLQYCSNFHICFVNDGSKDSTSLILQTFCKAIPNTEVLDLSQNLGKASAIREGVHYLTEKSYDLIGYLDADLATPLAEMLYLAEVMKTKPNVQCVMGARVGLLGRNVRRKLLRHYLGRIFATFASLSLGLHIYDTQCGAKIFRKDLANYIFKDPLRSRWLFDIELLFRIKKSDFFKNNPNPIYEFPLTEWNDIPGSKLKITDFFKAPLELLKIYWHYR